MKTITANIPARKLGKITLAARIDVFTQSDDGKWSNPTAGAMFEAEVIDICKRATNWPEIKAAHFPMHNFHN